jgi:hypothetical protein
VVLDDGELVLDDEDGSTAVTLELSDRAKRALSKLAELGLELRIRTVDATY